MSRDITLGVGIMVISVALGGFLGWASFVPLMEGVVGTGAVVVDTAHKTVQHLEGGIVETLHVKEGDEVREGDLLIELSRTQAQAELDLMESRYYARLAEMDRLNTERLLRERVAFSPELLERREDPRIADILEKQEDLFEAHRTQYLGQVAVLRHRIEQLEEQVRGLEASRKAKEREIALIERDLQGLRSMYEQQLVEEGMLIARQREYEQNVGALGSTVADVAAAKVAIGEARQEILQLEHELRTMVSDRIAEAQQEWFETQERIAAVKDVLQRTRIFAPQDGRVIGLNVHTLGAVIPPGQPIMNIVPSGEQLVIEGRIRPTDIDNVHMGQEARLRFSAFSTRTTPEVLGQVERVSPDAFQDQEALEPYYVARILVPEEELAKLGEEEIGPGMPVEIMFTGGERTAMEYLIDPLRDIVDKALVEE